MSCHGLHVLQPQPEREAHGVIGMRKHNSVTYTVGFYTVLDQGCLLRMGAQAARPGLQGSGRGRTRLSSRGCSPSASARSHSAARSPCWYASRMRLCQHT